MISHKFIMSKGFPVGMKLFAKILKVAYGNNCLQFALYSVLLTIGNVQYIKKQRFIPYFRPIIKVKPNIDHRKEQNMLQGFILGISNSATCLASCAPIILPYLMSCGKTIRNNLSGLIFFLIGRLTGYISFAILAWFIGKKLLTNPVIRSRFTGTALITLSLFLIIYNLSGNHTKCRFKNTANINQIISPEAWYYPYIFGLLTGINICPPFLMAFTDAVDSNSLLGSILFFFTFFAGTSIFFIPLSFIGSKKYQSELKTVGEFSLYIIAVYYFFKGFLSIGGTL